MSSGSDARSVLEEESLEEERRCKRRVRFLGEQNGCFCFFFFF